jgi:hypothetical protein
MAQVFLFPSVRALLRWRWAQAVMMMVLYGCYIESWLGLIIKTVRPHIRPYIDWLEYLKSWLKKVTRSTTKCIRSCCIVTSFAAAIYYLIYYIIWSLIYATIALVRGHIMEYFKPDLKRERERLCRDQLWQISASRRVYSTHWRGLPFLAFMNLVFSLAGPYGHFHPQLSCLPCITLIHSFSIHKE